MGSKISTRCVDVQIKLHTASSRELNTQENWGFIYLLSKYKVIAEILFIYVFPIFIQTTQVFWFIQYMYSILNNKNLVVEAKTLTVDDDKYVIYLSNEDSTGVGRCNKCDQ